MIRLTALLTAAALAVPLGTPLLAQEPHRGGVAERPERPAAEERARGEGQGGQRRPEAAPASRRLPPDSDHAAHTRAPRPHACASPRRRARCRSSIRAASCRPRSASPPTPSTAPSPARARSPSPSTAGRARLRPISISCVLGPWRLPLDGPSISPSAATGARAQRRDLARFHRSRLHRPGRYRLQPRRRLRRGHPQPLLQHRGRRRHAVGGDHALAAGRTTA